MNSYQKILGDQLAMNKISWQKLVQNGLTSNDEVQLDFWYYAANKENAEALKAFLEKETDYEVLVEVSGNSMWNIKGHTQKTEISLDILNQWVEWMVIAGQEFECQFDGWGVQL
jgi:Regulator of ribonuclease activity B